MNPGRTLGRARVLGSAKTLGQADGAQTPSPSPSPLPQHKRNTSLLSPTPSSASLSSQVSTVNSPAPLTPDTNDITSKVSLGHGDNTAAASASSRLVCPICNEEMVTLLQLNRHLDDNHQNLEEVEQDEVKTWFKAQMGKAKKFQPLVALNQKFKGLDMFEDNNVVHHSRSASGTATPEITRPMDPDEVVSRTHWQKPTYHDLCSDPLCGKRLAGANGSINCRKCGKLFCEEHTMYQMKLSRSAQWEPVRGIWCRVCETCYKSREGYNDHTGLERSHTDEFMRTRRKTIDRSYLEVSRLEKRLSKLTNLLADPPPGTESEGAASWFGLSSGKSQQRILEQSVVDWEDDNKVARCPFCQQDFSTYTFRRHHCRTCGRVVCGDPKTDCSAEVGLNVARGDGQNEKPQGQVGLDVRICKDCRHTLFSKADFMRELQHKPPDQRSYENLTQFERGIRLLLPKFQKLLQTLQNPDHPPIPTEIAEASKVRKRLTDSFIQYETAARRIRDMPTTSPTQVRLQKAVYQNASQFLHLHMLPLKSLPKVLKHASPHGVASSASRPHPPSKLSSTTAAVNGNALSSVRLNDRLETSSQVSSNSAIESLEAEEKDLRDRLIVLEEQKFIVSEMVADARKRRMFDEVAALGANVNDLTMEIDRINGQLGQLDFAGAYGNQQD